MTRDARPKRRAFVAASAALGVVMAFLLAEGAVRMYWWAKAREVLSRMASQTAPETINTGPGALGEGVRKSVFPDIVYELRPNLRGTYDGKRYRTDRFGFRQDRDIGLDKPAGVRRILGIGDSWMWGSGVDNGETYLDRVDADLSADGFSIETINTGVWGYDAVQEAATLARKGVSFSPDIVVVGLCSNDREYPNFVRADSYLSASGSAVLRLLHALLLKGGGSEEVDRAGALMPFSDLMDAYEEIAALARRHGFEVVVFSECLREPISVDECFLGTAEEWSRFLEAARGRWHFHLCGWDMREVVPNPPPWAHASPAGATVMARRLEGCLRPLLGTPTRPRPSAPP